MKAILSLLSIIILLVAVKPAHAQSLIDKSKSDLNKGSGNSSSGGSSKSSSSGSSKSSDGGGFSSDNSDDSFEDAALGAELLIGIMKGIMFITYYSTIGDYEEEEHLQNSITQYPLYNERSGNYHPFDSATNDIKVRFDVSNRFMFMNNIYGNQIDLNIRPLRYLYFHGGYTQLAEYVRTQNRYSYLALIKADIAYDRIKLEKFNLGWSIGMTYIPNDINLAGFAFGLKSEVFMVKKLSFEASARWCAVNHVPVNEYAIHCRYHLNRCFLSAGFEHLKIGTPSYDFVVVGGGIYW